MQILVAEDERITRLTLVRQLEGWGHTVCAVEDGVQAWERYQGGGFDLVLTDWDMPRLSGPELIQRIRETTGPSYAYVIMLTGHSDKSDVVQGIEAGADDFVCKPFDRNELRVRVLAGVRIVSLERTLSRQNVELRKANERIHHALEAAAGVQRSMLPKGNIVMPQVCTAWKYVPSEELAGDAIGLHLIDERYLVSYVIDVSGHGVPAALLSVSAMHAMEPTAGTASLLRDMTGAGGMGTVQRPARVAAEMNCRFRAGDNGGRYLTMILTVLDTQTGRLRFTSAGHPPLVVLRGAEIVPVAESGGYPIAWFDESEYEEAEMQLARGDRVFLYSDGLVEQTGKADGGQFGEERLLALLREGARVPVDALMEQAVAALSEWSGLTAFADDVSIAAWEWGGR